MTTLKDLIKLKPSKALNVQENADGDIKEMKLTYFQQGFGDSRDSLGHPSAFSSCLRNLYETYKDQCRKKDIEQQQLKQPYIDEQNGLQTEVDRKNTFVDLKETELQDIEKQVRGINEQISEVKVDPGKYGIKADKRPKAQFYIGLLVLLPITLYLIVFYMSASYSAFFKEFDTANLTAAIFDAQAFNKAVEDGLMEAIFVSTIPFAFMGLGYLIHMFQKTGATVKIAALFVVTFIFDCILAYQIEFQIYKFNKTLNSPPFDLQEAFQSVSFWGIIFAGFVVYIIWGLVFDFIMKEYDNLDRVEQFIRKLKEDKANLSKRKEDIKATINTVKEEITDLKGKLRELKAKIDGFIFPKQKYLVLHAEYTKGWIKAILKEIAMAHAEKDRLIYSCQEVEKDHLAKFTLGENEAENMIYSNNLLSPQ